MGQSISTEQRHCLSMGPVIGEGPVAARLFLALGSQRTRKYSTCLSDTGQAGARATTHVRHLAPSCIGDNPTCVLVSVGSGSERTSASFRVVGSCIAH